MKTDCSLSVAEIEVILEFLLENPVIWNMKMTDYRWTNKKGKMCEDQANWMGKTAAHLQGWFKSLNQHRAAQEER